MKHKIYCLQQMTTSYIYFSVDYYRYWPGPASKRCSYSIKCFEVYSSVQLVQQVQIKYYLTCCLIHWKLYKNFSFKRLNRTNIEAQEISRTKMERKTLFALNFFKIDFVLQQAICIAQNYIISMRSSLYHLFMLGKF